MIGQSPNVHFAPLSAIVRGLMPPAPPSLPLQAGTPFRPASDSSPCVLRDACRLSLRARLPLSAVGGRATPLPHIICRLPQRIRHTNAHLTPIAVCGGLRPPRPRSCGVCVPLRSWLRPRRYRLRNDSPALSRLVSCHPPFPHPLPPFPPRAPRGGTTMG